METNRDAHFIELALRLARRGLGRVWPNPAVGCILVRDGIIVGRGWTQPGGRPHAETEALIRAGAAAEGADAYVTLEPCAHQGKTAPCAQALIEARVARVVVAAGDPDERVAGRGIEALRAAGIEVVVGVLEAEARDLNAGFFSRIERKRPLVALKLATSLDGRIATAAGQSQWITGPEARAQVHRLRASHDAILTGIGTVEADDPALTCRLPGMAAMSPVAVVLDSQLRIAPDSQLVRGAPARPLMLLTGRAGEAGEFAKAGVEIATIALEDGGDHVSLPAALVWLAERGITRVMVEAGSRLAGAFLRDGLVDRLYWFRSSMVIGGDGRSVFEALGVDDLSLAPGFERQSVEAVGKDLFEIYLHQA